MLSPLLGKELKGPVYLVPGNHVLPDLLVDLQRPGGHPPTPGATKTVHGRLRNTFDMIPDVPVSKFALTIFGGKRGLLLNSADLCAKPQTLKSLTKRAEQQARPPRQAGAEKTPACSKPRRPATTR